MTTPRVTIDELPEQTTPLDTDLLVIQNTGVTKRVTIAALREALGSDDLIEDPPGSGLYYGTDLEEISMAALPAGGDTGDVLAKLSDDDYDATWVGGGGTGLHASTHAAGSTDPVTLTQAQVTNLTTDLAAKADATSLTAKADKAITISTTTPLAGGGDLSANRTLTVATFGTISSGVVPASGGGTVNYLRADGTWATPAGGGGGITTEDAVDAVAAALVEGVGIDIAYNDALNTITVTADKTEMSLSKSDVGLGSVDNTADTAKPVSTATQTALDLKVDESTTITTTAPLTIGGGASADLSTNRTLAVAAASDTAAGVVELATAAEVLTGTDTTRAVTAAGATGAFAPKYLAINAQTGTTYTLVLTDASKLVTLTNASAITLTVPTNASVAYPTGTTIDLAQLGAGQVTVAAAGGVTVNATPTLKFRAQYAAATLVKYATDTWLLVGDLATT